MGDNTVTALLEVGNDNFERNAIYSVVDSNYTGINVWVLHGDRGIFAQQCNTAIQGVGYEIGVEGKADSSGGIGVRGEGSIDSSCIGVYGFTIGGKAIYGFDNAGGYGVYGFSYDGFGIKGESYGINPGVAGYNGGTGAGGKFQSSSYYDIYCDGAMGVYSTNGYTPFTGSHEALISKEESFSKGDIVVDKRIFHKQNISNVITEVELSITPMQPNVVGVVVRKVKMSINDILKEPENTNKEYLKLVSEGKIKKRDTKDFEVSPSSLSDYPNIKEEMEDIKRSYYCIQMNALGEGQVRVCKEGGNIKTGDYICSSSEPGKGMKQADDLYHNYTVAKARENCKWKDDDEDIKMIACIYLCG
jgi:hypothetical protein